MKKEDVLSIIPKPKNEEIIAYDLSLKSLIDKDVFLEYNNDLNTYKFKKEKYLIIDAEIKEYEKNINNIYLYNKTWTEEDYIKMLQNDKKTYSIMFGDIKKIVNNIEISTKKYNTINEKIEMQIKKEQKELEDKKKTINNEIEEYKNNILLLKTKISELEIDKKRIEEQITDLQDEINLCLSMQQELEDNTYKCKYCGTIITNKNSKKKIYNILEKNIQKASQKLEKYTKNFEKTETNIAYYENELKKNKSNLNNSIQFKKQDYNFYSKKSIKVLELEAFRDEILKNIDVLKKEYESNKETKNPKYLELKDRISKYELSLQNLEKIKKAKENFKDKYNEAQKLKSDLLKLYDNLTLYKKFIEIFYKIYQQKANDYFGNNIKFKFYKFNNLQLEEIFEIYYNGIEYTQLNKALKEELDNIYFKKLSYFL